MYVEAGICQIQSQCEHICMSVCNYECMYVHIYTIFICIEAQGFVIDFSSGSIFCILHTRLFRPRRSHKPCFYNDKIQHIIYTHKCIYMFMYTITSEKICTVQRVHSHLCNSCYKCLQPAHSGNLSTMNRAKSINITLVVA